jgi:ribosome biogenesis GTPase / thiamine phosphate phosphatase
MTENNGPVGTVLSVTRRKVKLLVGETLQSGVVATASLDVCVGDQVSFALKRDEVFINQVLHRRNSLRRSYQGVTKNLAANLDRLYLVSSVRPLFQPLFIDRVIAVCEAENIPVYLIINKSDLGLELTSDLIRIYERLDVPLLYTSAKYGKGLDELEKSLAQGGLRVVALAGLSGVGKSTILNCLIPEAGQRTSEVSSRTGHGRQTTSQAVGYRYAVPSTQRHLLIIDMPGVQNFGVSHLTKAQIAAGFLEFGAYANDCEFDNCSHIAEEKCAVKAAVARSEIAETRYQSYVHMLHEVEAARKY